jgi:hypothetical protein
VYDNKTKSGGPKFNYNGHKQKTPTAAYKVIHCLVTVFKDFIIQKQAYKSIMLRDMPTKWSLLVFVWLTKTVAFAHHIMAPVLNIPTSRRATDVADPNTAATGHLSEGPSAPDSSKSG